MIHCMCLYHYSCISDFWRKIPCGAWPGFYVAAAGLLVVIHESWVRGDQRLTKDLIKSWFRRVKKTVDLCRASSGTRLQCATASRKVGADLCYSQPPTRHLANTARPRVWAGVSRDMPVYSPSFRQVLILACTQGRLRLSRPGCLVPRRGGLPVQRRDHLSMH